MISWPELFLNVLKTCDLAVVAMPISKLSTWVKNNVRLWEDDSSAAIPRPRHRKEGKSAPGAFQAKKVEANVGI